MNRVYVARPWLTSDADATEQFAQDVGYYLRLQPRQLPSRYLYDPLGSALFEAICRLPWYRITRAETRLLEQHGAELLELLAPLGTIVELGSGSGDKLRVLLAQQEHTEDALDVHLIDVSEAALEASARALASAPGVRVTTHRMRYEDGLRGLRERRDGDGHALALFLGSNIGNYDPPGANALVSAIRRHLRPGDALLLGADLMKPVRDLELAYDDPLGVTAAFNRNLLVRINRELDGDFDLAAYTHLALWNAEESRVEMHLVSQAVQEVRVPAVGMVVTLEAGERIWTESSYKYRARDLSRILEAASFEVRRQWIDPEARFALTLAQAV